MGNKNGIQYFRLFSEVNFVVWNPEVNFCTRSPEPLVLSVFPSPPLAEIQFVTFLKGDSLSPFIVQNSLSSSIFWKFIKIPKMIEQKIGEIQGILEEESWVEQWLTVRQVWRDFVSPALLVNFLLRFGGFELWAQFSNKQTPVFHSVKQCWKF